MNIEQATKYINCNLSHFINEYFSDEMVNEKRYGFFIYEDNKNDMVFIYIHYYRGEYKSYTTKHFVMDKEEYIRAASNIKSLILK